MNSTDSDYKSSDVTYDENIYNNLSSEEKEVLDTFIKWQQAMIDKDIDTLDRLALPNTTFTHMSGKTQTKSEYFEEIKNGTLNYFKSEIENPTITINGNEAILKAEVTLTARVYGASGSWTLPVNTHFEKIDGTWYYGTK